MDATGVGDGRGGGDVTVDEGLEFTVGEEAFSESFHVGEGDALSDGELFIRLKVELAHIAAGGFADEQMSIGERQVLQAADESVLEGLEACFAEFEIDETGGEHVEEAIS